MSKYWGYYCRTCNEATDHWHNHGEELLDEYYRAWHLIRTLQPLWIEVRTLTQWADIEVAIFLGDHEGHDIALQSDRGDIADLPHRRAAATGP